MDLTDFSKYKRFNGGYRYILVAIDSLCRFLRTLLLKTKRPAEMKRATIRLFWEGNASIRIFCDRGGELYKETFKKHLARKKVFMYSTFSPVTKASQAERVTRTLHDRIFHYFRVTGKYHFVSVLPKIVRDYHNTKHRTLGISPSEVTPETKLELFNKINGKPVIPSMKKKLKLGYKGRVLLHREGFQKSSEGSWSPQIFTVSRLRDTSPPVVHLEDYRGKEVDGSFYPKELLVVTRDAEMNYGSLSYVTSQRKKARKTEGGVGKVRTTASQCEEEENGVATINGAPVLRRLIESP
ncbi:uncharacterized protein LOC135395846 [Ornithodoros turicata]|uniref:uncharacterized protein LOC135395846 n=1 Tax=Ornithodoros turicata TaxID=34597 RepID=UPI00313996C6